MIKRQRQKDEKGYAFPQTDTLSWDEQGQLKTFRNDRITAEYGYDGLGRRVFSKTTPAGDNLSDIRWFWWDGDALLYETRERTARSESMTRACELDNVNGELARQQHLEELTDSHPPQEYVYYPHTFEPFALITGNDIREQEDSLGRISPPAGRVCFYHNNVNGAPVRLTDASGDIVWSLQAGAWGDNSQTDKERVYNPLRYQGQYFDNESGLHYNRYRYYEPESGRFISQDPIGLNGGLNLYQYAPNPLSYIDPLGLAKCGVGEYKDVGGHHVHGKAGFKNNPNYDPKKGFSISQDYMDANKLDHQLMTNYQRSAFTDLANSGRPNTLAEHTKIAVGALEAGGATTQILLLNLYGIYEGKVP